MFRIPAGAAAEEDTVGTDAAGDAEAGILGIKRLRRRLVGEYGPITDFHRYRWAAGGQRDGQLPGPEIDLCFLPVDADAENLRLRREGKLKGFAPFRVHRQSIDSLQRMLFRQ